MYDSEIMAMLTSNSHMNQFDFFIEKVQTA